MKEYGEKLQVRIEELEKTIWEEAGEEFNINSPKQLGVILFEKMKLPGGKKTRPDIPLQQMCWISWRRTIQIVADILNTGSLQEAEIHLCRRSGLNYR